jgi:hypothetical protein
MGFSLSGIYLIMEETPCFRSYMNRTCFFSDSFAVFR